jgi:hypothetical protein
MRHRRPIIFGLTVLACALAGSACALASTPVSARRDGEHVQISPIVSQAVAFSTPARFVAGEEQGAGRFYIRELVPRGETVNRWTEMITVTGLQGAATVPKLTPLWGLQTIASSFAKACPSTFNALQLGMLRIGTYDAETAVLSCGTNLQLRTPRSETALIVSFRGRQDLYTLQWAVRGAPSRDKLALHRARWLKRLDRLQPIRGVRPRRGKQRGQPGGACGASWHDERTGTRHPVRRAARLAFPASLAVTWHA